MKSETYNWVAAIIGVLTFLVVLWYTIETRRMQQAVAKQSEEITRQIRLSIMPAFALKYREGRKSFYFSNIGNGSALKIEFEPLILDSQLGLEAMVKNQENKAGLIFQAVPLMESKQEIELNYSFFPDDIVESDEADLLCKLVPSHNDNSNNRAYELLIRFQDIEGTSYTQTIFIEKGYMISGPIYASGNSSLTKGN